MSCEKSSHEDLDVATGALSAAERSYPKSEVRGRSREDPVPEGRRPRGVTLRPRSGRWPREATPRLRPGVVARRSNPTPKARSGGREEQPHVQGVVAARAQEGLE